MNIKFIDLQRQYQKYKSEINAQIKEVLDSSSYIMGAKIGELEEDLARFVGVKHAVSCSSGTDALLLALLAMDVKANDEIIVPAFTFIATAEVIPWLGAKPVFVDIKEDTFNLDPKKIEKAITKNTKGIIAVDLFGQCADYDEIKSVADKNNLFIIEDAAQSFGAEYKHLKAGSLGDIGCTSFFPAKPLGCYGDGGMIFLNDEKRAEVIKSLRVHGKGKNKYDNIRIGLNARMDTLQAAVLLAKFEHYSEELIARQNVVHYYSEKLNDSVIVPKVLDHNLSAFAQYCIRVKKRDDIKQALKNSGIPTAIHYPRPLHLQPAFSYLKYKEGDFPVSEKISEDILAIPMHPFLLREEQDLIIKTIQSFTA